ncbi:hypothetical protein L1887_38643 [Cichorium endivia]|nr:hypothetical protein L1887_38643 [Cichorium endivia]
MEVEVKAEAMEFSQLGNVAQASTQSASSSVSVLKLQNNYNMIYLQISEVVNSLKDLIEYSRETRIDTWLSDYL